MDRDITEALKAVNILVEEFDLTPAQAANFYLIAKNISDGMSDDEVYSRFNPPGISPEKMKEIAVRIHEIRSGTLTDLEIGEEN